jgi:hypothetical protein
MRRREFIGLRLSESESNLTLSEKRFCRQRRDMWCFDSASPWTCLLSARRREFITLIGGTARRGHLWRTHSKRRHLWIFCIALYHGQLP